MTRSHTRTRGHRLNPSLPEGALLSDSDLLGPLEVKAITDALGARPTKVLSQNFVHDVGAVRCTIRAEGVQAGDKVVKVGPGLGSLTLTILERGARVHAVEIDPVLARTLPETIRSHVLEAAERFHVVLNGTTRVKSLNDLGVDWPTPTKLVANLLYNVAVPVLLVMLEPFPSLSGILMTVQSEIAGRLTASPGSHVYGVSSVEVAWYGTTERAGTIRHSVFWSVSNVDSTLVRLRRAGEPRGEERLCRTAFEICDVAFGQRYKALRAALKTWMGSARGTEAFLERADIDPSARGETLNIEHFVVLGCALIELRKAGVLIERVDPRNGESPRSSSEAKTMQSTSSTLLDSSASNPETVDNV